MKQFKFVDIKHQYFSNSFDVYKILLFDFEDKGEKIFEKKNTLKKALHFIHKNYKLFYHMFNSFVYICIDAREKVQKVWVENNNLNQL